LSRSSFFLSIFFFYSSRRRHTRSKRDWSSDVCSSDLNSPGFIKPEWYIELHIEQGPILENENTQIGAVYNLQGNSRREITFTGQANHAGSTPNKMRKDPMQAFSYFSSSLFNYINDNELDTRSEEHTSELQSRFD